MKLYKTLFAAIIICFFTNYLFAQKLEVNKCILKEDHTIKSKIMDKDYQLYMSFPSSYTSKDTINYPVLYVLDGKYMFSIIDGTRVNLDFENKIEDVIIVGIGSGKDIGSWQTNRTYEFTPSEDKSVKKFESGGAKQFLECIKTEIIPFVDKHYKTNGDNGILGHSLGGLFTTYTFLNAPNSFSRYGISSPSLMWKNNELLNETETILTQTKTRDIPSIKVFISAGGNEEEAMTSGMTKLSDLLEKNGNNIQVTTNVFEDESHLSVVSAMISRALSVLYGKNHKNINSDFVITNITDNVYSIVSPSVGLPTPENKGWNSNVHFVVTRSGVLLFDTGSSETIGNKIKKAIKTVTNQPVRWVVNSHSHADHWFGNAAFPDAEIITSSHALKTMKEHGQRSLEFYSKVTKGTIGFTQLMYPTSILTKGQKRNFEGLDVAFIMSNDGHSPGDILMWLPKQKIIFGGDVLSSDYMPMITGHGNVSNLISTLNAIIKLNPTIVLTGHGKGTTVKSLIRDVNLLSSIWEQVKSDYKKGRKPEGTLLDIKTKLKPKYNSLYKNFDSEIERYVKLMYKLQ